MAKYNRVCNVDDDIDIEINTDVSSETEGSVCAPDIWCNTPYILYNKRLRPHTDEMVEMYPDTTFSANVHKLHCGLIKGAYDIQLNQEPLMSVNTMCPPERTLFSISNMFSDSDVGNNKHSNQQRETTNNYNVDLSKESENEYVDEIIKPDLDGDNFLFIAIILQFTDLSLMLINCFPDFKMFNHANHHQQTALHLAALTDNQTITRRLVVAGIEIDRRDGNGNTALHIACKHGNLDLARSLLVPVTYLETKQNLYEIPYQKIPQNLEIRNSEGLTCLLIAAVNNNKEMIDLLISKEANINAVDMKNGKTCLHIFAENGNVCMIKHLMSKSGLNLNARNYSGFTAAEMAHYRGHHFVVSQLLYAGTDPNIRSLDSADFQAESDYDSSSDEDMDTTG